MNLATAFGKWFEHLGQRQDLNDAISMYRESLEILPTFHLNWSAASNIASVLEARFKLTGQQEDLDEAISFNRRALELLPVQHTF